jgi:lipopolysaccharide transport system permease protein
MASFATQADGVHPAQFDYIIQPRRHVLSLPLEQLWASGELLYFLIWRDLVVRYKQAVIGAGWAVLKPLLMMLVFVAVFGMIVRVPTSEIPYSLFIYAGLLPWTLVSTVIGTTTTSLITNRPLLTKIYFPRLVIPISASLVALVDLVISLPLLFGLMLWFDIPITARVLLLPLLFGLIFLLSLGLGLIMAALHVRYHDVGMLMPILLQTWLYLSPVIYPIDIVPSRWLVLYSLNPIVGLLQGIRWALYGAPSPTPLMIGMSGLMTLLVLIGGILFFQFAEDTFADVV